MALTPADFLAAPDGTGHFIPEYFPGVETLAARQAAVTGVIAAGVALAVAAGVGAGAEQDAAVRRYVNWQIVYTLWLALVAVPASAVIAGGDVNTGWTADQRKALQEFWLAEQAAWEGELADDVAPEPDPFPFGAVPKDATWE